MGLIVGTLLLAAGLQKWIAPKFGWTVSGNINDWTYHVPACTLFFVVGVALGLAVKQDRGFWGSGVEIVVYGGIVWLTNFLILGNVDLGKLWYLAYLIAAIGGTAVVDCIRARRSKNLAPTGNITRP